MRPDASAQHIAELEAARDRAQAEFVAYLRGPFVAAATNAVLLQILADVAERQATTITNKPERA